MIRHVRWGGSMMALALATTPIVAQPDAPTPAKPSWFARLFQSDSATPGSFAEEQAAKERLRYGPLEPEVRAQALVAEQEAFQRRMDVCLKLRQIAVQENDDALYQQADDLQAAAGQLYQMRVARLGVATTPPPADSLKATSMDQPAPVIPAAPPSKQTPTSKTAPKREFHEVKP